MKFSIVTPSYNQLDWLQLCVRSVAEQRQDIPELEIEHLIQDAGSADIANLKSHSEPGYDLQIFCEPDLGMYDAINRGLRKATGDICAYLNCDEQYLPGALASVRDYFLRHSDVDVVFADAVVVDENGDYVCSRLAQVPFRDQFWFRLTILSCATFIRRSALLRHSLFLNAEKKVTGDVFWIGDMQKAGLKMHAFRSFTSTFTDTTTSLGMGREAEEEFLEIRKHRPLPIRVFLPAYVLYHRLRSLLSGVYFQKPFEYSLYTRGNPGRRSTHRVFHPTQIWKSRLDCDRDAIRNEKRKAFTLTEAQVDREKKAAE